MYIEYLRDVLYASLVLHFIHYILLWIFLVLEASRRDRSLPVHVVLIVRFGNAFNIFI